MEPVKDNRTGGRSPRGGGRGPRRNEEPKEFDQKTLDLARVTRVTKGGKRMRFRACVVIGDHKGRVGYGIGKGIDVQAAVGKAARKAQKSVIRVPIVNGTIPHMVEEKYAAAVILMKPAPKGTGIKAGGAARALFELSGIQNISAKTLGSKNKINNVRATMAAFAKLHIGKRETKQTVA